MQVQIDASEQTVGPQCEQTTLSTAQLTTASRCSPMNVLHSAQQLVHEKADVVVAERLGAVDDAVEVRVHELLHNVNVFKVGRVCWLQDFHDCHYVIVFQVAVQLHLAQQTLALNLIREHIRDLQCKHEVVAEI
jgi:hypothetical protein